MTKKLLCVVLAVITALSFTVFAFAGNGGGNGGGGGNNPLSIVSVTLDGKDLEGQILDEDKAYTISMEFDRGMDGNFEANKKAIKLVNGSKDVAGDIEMGEKGFYTLAFTADEAGEYVLTIGADV
nr:hypothetical protein [Clostridiales bacterium]